MIRWEEVTVAIKRFEDMFYLLIQIGLIPVLKVIKGRRP